MQLFLAPDNNPAFDEGVREVDGRKDRDLYDIIAVELQGFVLQECDGSRYVGLSCSNLSPGR